MFLTETQRPDLKKDFPDLVDEYIERLSFYMEQSGKQYCNHEAIIRKWILEDRPKHQKMEEVYEEGECL